LESDLERLIEGLTLSYHRLTARADALHGPRGVTTGIRALILLLEQAGPLTMSEIAAARSVSRQFIQRLCQSLAAGGWIETRPNPRHRRSPLIALSEKGKAEAGRIRALEAPLLAQLAAEVPAQDLARAADVLARLAERLGAEA